MGATDGVARRHVLFISGFDPQGPVRYHALYAQESRKQAAVTGAAYDVGARERAGAHTRWQVTSAQTHTTITQLRWDDLVRALWPSSRWALAVSTVRETAGLLARGVLWRGWQTSWPGGLAVSLPALSLLAVAGGTLALVAALALAAWPWAVVAGLLLALALWVRRQAQSAWLMRSMRAIAMQAQGKLPQLEARLDAFAQVLRDTVAAAAPGDEVLLVGHSSGAMLAASTLARALALQPDLLTRGPTVAVLTLGHCAPMLSYEPAADRFRAELARLRTTPGLTWVDITSPIDGCCSALSDPTAYAAGQPGRGPMLVNAQWHKAFGRATYTALRRDKYRCHFQYLMATEQPSRSDYFAITAGPETLAQRFAGAGISAPFTRFQRLGNPLR